MPRKSSSRRRRGTRLRRRGGPAHGSPGPKTYQVVGEPESRELGSGEGSAAAEGDSDESDSSSGVDEDDVELVAMRAGVDEDTAREALEANDGDLADAVDELE